MGREIRRVPPGWEHPRYTRENTLSHLARRIGGYRPLLDKSFSDAMREWVDEWEAWERGERPSYFDPARYPDGIEFHEWHGRPPDPDYHRPAWSNEEATHFQFYENVSEGTPLSPPMESLEALANWLSSHKDFWGHGPRTKEEASAFCRVGWAPTAVILEGKYKPGLEAMADLAIGRNDDVS